MALVLNFRKARKENFRVGFAQVYFMPANGNWFLKAAPLTWEAVVRNIYLFSE